MKFRTVAIAATALCLATTVASADAAIVSDVTASVSNPASATTLDNLADEFGNQVQAKRWKAMPVTLQNYAAEDTERRLIVDWLNTRSCVEQADASWSGTLEGTDGDAGAKFAFIATPVECSVGTFTVVTVFGPETQGSFAWHEDGSALEVADGQVVRKT